MLSWFCNQLLPSEITSYFAFLSPWSCPPVSFSHSSNCLGCQSNSRQTESRAMFCPHMSSHLYYEAFAVLEMFDLLGSCLLFSTSCFSMRQDVFDTLLAAEKNLSSSLTGETKRYASMYYYREGVFPSFLVCSDVLGVVFWTRNMLRLYLWYKKCSVNAP